MKRKLASCLLLTSVFFISQSFLPDGPPPSQGIEEYEQNPPIVEKFWVQKLAIPLEDGRNLKIFVKFYDEFAPAENFIDARYGTSSFETFYDDGTGPDAVANDKIYTALVAEDLQAFTDKIQEYLNNIATLDVYTQFEGHVGHAIGSGPTFDFEGFNNFVVVDFDMHIIDGAFCGSELKKERSLFITDLAVVEDPERTYNVVDGSGNPDGVWTFGHLIRGIVNNGSPNAARDFLREWLKTWTNPTTVNGHVADTRMDVVPQLIAPWIRRANSNSTLSIDANNWENEWNNTHQDSLLKYAPFRLMAIVNRLDLRGNGSYIDGVKDAGETRFIYTLISPYPFSDYSAGDVPIQGSQDNNAPNKGFSFVDWDGMNIIFEYGNVQTTHCQLKEFAMDWLDLSAFTPGSNDFNGQLEAITGTVTAANAVPGRPNGSALRRIRTNERIFQSVQKNQAGWVATDWEFRQFELNALTHQFEMVPLTNTPRNLYNYAENITVLNNPYTTTNANGIFVSRAHADTLLRWVRNNKMKVHLGKHLLPATFGNITDNYVLAGAGRVNGEYNHYLGFDWEELAKHTTINRYEKEVRNQLSLNTCQGCHAGETKTLFTHILPLPYGEAADYAGNTPGNLYRKFDGRFFDNKGYTGSTNPGIDNYVNPGTHLRYVPKVSAFLTGRNYTGTGIYTDDSLTTNEDATDHTLHGDFWVNDPNNNAVMNEAAPNDLKFGYNDLERRKRDLCQFVTIQCATGTGSPGKTLQLITGLSFVPFADGAH